MRPRFIRHWKEEIMKRIFVFSTVFALAFAITAGVVLFGNTPAQAKPLPGCEFTLPCDIEDIYCTSTPCQVPDCHKIGGVFYCLPDWNTPYCSADYWLPVPCSN
jgi:hypothetical protein